MPHKPDIDVLTLQMLNASGKDDYEMTCDGN